MIKINLAAKSSGVMASSTFDLPDSGDADIRQEALKRVLFLLIGPVALFLYENQHVPTLRAELSSKSQTVSELTEYNAQQEASVLEIKKFKEEEALIEARIDALEKISRDRQKEIKILDLLQTVIPENAWLTSISMDSNRLLVKGMALSSFDVSTFLDLLTRSALLLDVNLVGSNEVVHEGRSFQEYEISAMLGGLQ